MKKWLIPLIALIGVLAAITLAVTPIIKATPRAIPVALLNGDQAATVNGQSTNFGQTVVTNLTTPAAGLNLPVKWLICSDQACIDNALSTNIVYAAIVIPADFTSTMSAAQTDSSTAPDQISVTINQGKNPAVAVIVASIMAQVGQTAGLAFNTSYINQVPSDEGNGTPATLLAVMMLFAGLITTIVLVNVIKVDYSKRSGRAKAILQQVGMAAGLAAVTALVAPPIIGGLAGAKLPYWNLVVLIFIGFFAVATIVLFSVDWLGLRGLVIPALVLLLGIPILALPYEALLTFWQNDVYPWVPQRFMIEGTRGVLFLGQKAGNPSTLGLAVTAVIGLAILFASLARAETKAVVAPTGKSSRAGKSGNPALNPDKARRQ